MTTSRRCIQLLFHPCHLSLRRSMGSLRSFSLQINEKGGEVNAGYDDEKAAGEVKSGGGEAGQEPWMNNYVPFGKNPSGNPIEQVNTTSNLIHITDIFEQVTFTNEQDREGGENVDKEELKKNRKGENWKENYVPYDDNKEDGGDNKEREAKKGLEGDADEVERDADEKDEQEEGKEKL